MGAQSNRLRVLFVDKITPSSLWRVWTLGRSAETIWHFEPIAPLSRRLLGVFQRLGLIRAQVSQIKHHIGQVRNDAGDIELARFLGYTRDICTQIRRKQLERNPLIDAMGSTWERSKILLYFEKLAEYEARMECLRIGLIEWMLRTKLGIAPTQCVMLIEKKQWFPYLETHARSQGIRLAAYGRRGVLTALARSGVRLLVFSTKALLHVLKVVQRRIRAPAPSVDPHESPGQSGADRRPTATLAINYWHRKLSFDPADRSEFFWLNDSGIPYSEVLLYDYVSDVPLDTETVDQLSWRGIKLLGNAPGVSAWKPTSRMHAVGLRVHLKLVLGTLKCLARRQKVSLYFLRTLSGLAQNYAYWYDFYSANQVRVNVGTLNTTVGQVLALDALNGVSAGYQITASNIIYPFHLSAGENVQFVFSPLFERLWRTFETPTDNFVHTGFINDNAIKGARDLGRVGETRKRLQAHGASFLLSFFDENSANRWHVYAWDKEAAYDYEFLLRWLLADPTLGIVFKPKHSPTLFQRIAPVTDLIEQARQTGRCEFLTSDHIVGSVYPAEAALMADVCIGTLGGTTAALEARLAGLPTVMVDTQGFRTHPFYAWGRGRVVFEDWVSLRAAIEQYRAAPEANPDLGNWSPGINDFDPFQDGQASLRMGHYIQWIYEALKKGASRQDALSMAAERHKQRWGHATTDRPEVLEAGQKANYGLQT